MKTLIRIILAFLAVFALVACNKGKDEPRVVCTQEDGQQTTEIVAVEVDESCEVMDHKDIPAEAATLHERARREGQQGNYKAALSLLEQAAELAPRWAYPHYDMAFTYLLQGDATKALAKYRQVDELEPGGFFTTKTAVWCLEREGSGKFPPGAYLAYVSLEWAAPEERVELIEQLTQKLPAFAPAWKEKALLTEAPEGKLSLIDKALSLKPDAETYGILMLNKAAALQQTLGEAAALEIVDSLIASDSSTTGTRTLAKEMYKMLSQ